MMELQAPFVANDTVPDAVAQAVRRGLVARPKRLPPWFLYDAEGSSLFDEITELPEYYLTRTERTILEERADEMVDAAGPPLAIVELGAGSSVKTDLIVNALLAQQRRAIYVPVDLSPAALAAASARLRPRFPRLEVKPVLARYPEQMDWLRDVPPRRLVLFLGSKLGDHDPIAGASLLREMRRHLAPGDALLIGTDLRKSPELLLPAYDDAAGVTARFNRNVLTRINRDLGGHFDEEAFGHVAAWDPRSSKVDLFLQSTHAQTVAIDGLGLRIPFATGERLHTESSHKFTPESARALIAAAGLVHEEIWMDVRKWFAVHLVRVPGARSRWPM